MEDAPIIAGLLAKRAQIEAEIADLERQVRQRQTKLRQLDTAICLFAPSLARAKRDVTRFQRSVHFVSGELTRRVQTALREAAGPITADEIAVQAIRDKGLDMGDGELRQDITRRFLWTLNRMLARGVVTKQGWGAAARWGKGAPNQN
jgi:multidrug resistance efflux pump